MRGGTFMPHQNDFHFAFFSGNHGIIEQENPKRCHLLHRFGFEKLTLFSSLLMKNFSEFFI
ncbi:hypothetical protein Mucpa_1788 [Mucilaginibacter paludis DSM 18603]|uniref:Uncharacterized protein n=1 Tax=Mucilaginibacter paludis DSM 18603 TaxID=714943 RepID=H1YA61_9SPHI|nr:hypothetical protein Mucpa_1788 [Mucilaginibacter paludis DSM 18603]